MSENIFWGERAPGSDMIIKDNEILLGVGIPNFVRLPSELGGYEAKVISAFTQKCPRCEQIVRHLELQDGYYVSECSEHMFLWYTKRKVSQ
jgi:hypothetical protein